MKSSITPLYWVGVGWSGDIFLLMGMQRALWKKQKKLLKELKKLINTADNGRKIQEGIRTVNCRKAKCRKIIITKCTCRWRSGDCNGHWRDDKGYSGRAHSVKWCQPEYRGYGGDSSDRGCSGKDWRWPGGEIKAEEADLIIFVVWRVTKFGWKWFWDYEDDWR